MKRFISILIAFATLLTLYACSGGFKDSTTTTNQGKTEDVTNIGLTETTETNGTTGTTGTTDTGKESTTMAGSLTTTASTTKFSTVTQPDLHEPVQPSAFDDAIFVGDSITNNLYLYVNREKNYGRYPLGKAKMLYAVSLSYANSLWELNRKGNVHPSFGGQKVRVPDGVKLSGAKKVFIMLGMNDFMGYGAEKTAQNAQKLINQILEKSPDVTIYVQSITPVLAAKEEGSRNNANVRKANQKLKEMCERNGWIYLDVASALIDENGCLKSNYCSDPGKNGMGIHINDYACKAWIEYVSRNVFQTSSEPPTTTSTTTTTQATTVSTTTLAPETTVEE